MNKGKKNHTRDTLLRALKDGIQALGVSNLTFSRHIVCRDEHCKAIVDFLNEPVHHTMQLFGMPGTGKTATIHYALAQLATQGFGKPTAVFLNGYVIQKSTDIYWTLFCHLMQTRLGYIEKCPVDQCSSLVEKRFRVGWGSPPSMCVIVIDEVDKVLEKHAKALFKVIDWLSLPFACCKLITISNSMDLAVDAKTKSRLDITKQLVFLPYGIHELKEILVSRLSGIEPKLFSDQAINLLCHQTASHYGDGRRLLQSASAAVCRVVMKIEENNFSYVPAEAVITVKEVYGVVRQVFQDRFVEFIKTIRTPILFIVVCVLAKETERTHGHFSQDNGRLLLERLFVVIRQLHTTYGGSHVSLNRASFLELIVLLQQVSLIDLSSGDDQIPIYALDTLLDSSNDDVFVSLLQPFQAVIDACRLHDHFGAPIASYIL
ncbi:unnamed protein product [Phytomonas sp. EM1]|nr:unnamed protein product [Phytomonas sp. EM1]|eukprot:CCW62454.1 unnamed protein product [Phytomonas sp. isolate EM1]